MIYCLSRSLVTPAANGGFNDTGNIGRRVYTELRSGGYVYTKLPGDHDSLQVHAPENRAKSRTRAEMLNI